MRYTPAMKFEFDEAKSRGNKEKHGIDFVEAQALWGDEDRFELRLKTKSEPRFQLVGMIGEKHWTAIVTYRGDRIRIISVRRSRTKEVSEYDEGNRS